MDVEGRKEKGRNGRGKGWEEKYKLNKARQGEGK